ncbi:hypothetical protein J25TS5_28240 [Paenibacillus faecis]|uniref:hypothetical protein n=1 Tax=Paenibacillus faecis TaxID=862114 RepID=UPI001AFE2A84|nr:hypothetical protein [Paenibacillus faecis]GIO85892.1 hypothetical protein J25TS5_28240 [Paenibacillus faecis]
MRRKQVILTLVFLGVLMAVTACGTRAGQPEATQVQPEPTATVNTETGQFDPKYDLKNPDFFSKFVAYFDLDKAALIQKLQQDYKEAPIEGTDSATGMPWVKLEKAGLTFYLTEEDEVPVSHVEIAETNPIHYGGARGQMTFSDVMKKAGETMVMEDPDLEKRYSITYPMKEVSVVFYTNNVYDPSSTMEVSSWGYYDQEPTLRSANEIQTNRGSFQLPRNWVGKISLREMVNTYTLSYLGKKEAYPLVEIVAMNVREWNEMDQAEYKIIFENEDGVVAARRLETNQPSDQEEAEVYLSMESQVDEMLATFQPAVQMEEDYRAPNVFTIKKNDTTVKFSLQFPESWKGKYVIKQYEDQIDIFHNTALESPAWIMNISGATPEEWAASPPDEYPWNKLGEINGVVIVYTQLADQAYESTYVEEEEEVTKMLMDIEDVQLIEADESED